MTSKQIVVKKWPAAFSTRSGRSEHWVYASGCDLQPIGEGKTEAASWDDAAKKLNNTVDSGKAAP